jgi:AbrB family looped-hinge helix DNA binding protein
MSTTTEIDGAGRLVVPKKLRDALHLLPGTKVSLRLDGESIVLQADVPGNSAYRKQGLWVHHAGGSVTAEEIRAYVEDGRSDTERRRRREGRPA